MRIQWVGVVVAISACGQPVGHPALEISLSAKDVVDATPVRVHVVATKADGKLGTGLVKVTSEAGSLTTPVEVQLDSYGTATVELVCDANTVVACTDPVRVTATWVSDNETTTAFVVLNSGGSTASNPTGSNVGEGSGAGSGNCKRLPDGGTQLGDIFSVNGSLGTAMTGVHFTVFGSSGGSGGASGFDYFTSGLTVPTQPWFREVSLSVWPEGNLGVGAKTGSNTGRAGAVPSGGPTFLNFSVRRSDGTLAICPSGSGSGSVTFDTVGPGGSGLHGTYSFSCSAANINVNGCFRYQ